MYILTDRISDFDVFALDHKLHTDHSLVYCLTPQEQRRMELLLLELYLHGNTLYFRQQKPLISLQIPLHYLTVVEGLNVEGRKL